jgi:TonB family protein
MKKRIRPILTLIIAVACTSRVLASNELDAAPVAIHQEPPEYPFSMRLDGKRGEVLLEFTVMEDGSVSNPQVVKSSHPDFEAPAVEALLKWRFRPGTKDGHPVSTRMRVPIIFGLTQMPDGSNGYEVWNVPSSAPRSFPPELQYDEPPKPLVISAPVYPFDLLVAKVKGKASVSFLVDPTGRTQMVKVISASQPEFGAAAMAMAEAWTFEPARKGGKPSWAILRKDEDFSRSSEEFPLNESAERLLKALKKQPCPIVKDAHLLDAIPTGRFLPSPVVPPALEKSGKGANAEVEFVIDHAGHAQLPRIISASDTDFGWAAATAVARWQFTIPTRGGKPVDLIARIPLAYNPLPKATAGP